MQRKHWTFAAGVGAAITGLIAYRRTRPQRESANIREQGRGKSATTRLLETGARLVQPAPPLSQFDVYLVGFHPMKDDPSRQMEAHHFCRQINEDLMQCVLFSGNTPDAHLNGIEYIISERLYETLPDEERQYWHPHNYEILSGTLSAPGLPEPAEHALMKRKVNSYGKTWHTWNTGAVDEPGDAIPLGPALLAWSFNRDGELRDCILRRMESDLKIDTAEKRHQRSDLAQHAHPQNGVNVLRGAFPNATNTPAGVIDAEDARRV